jgi:hypothetical protein
LSDNLDVKTRIANGPYEIRCKDISRRTKKFLYQSIPLITVMWGGGGEIWVLKLEEKIMLEVFHHGAIRGVLGISRQRVRDGGKTLQ